MQCALRIFIWMRILHFCFSTNEANKTELHFGMQLYMPSTKLLQTWTNHIVSYINEMDMVQNYTLVADFLNSPGGLTNRGHAMMAMFGYLTSTRAYCYIGNHYSDRTLVTADITWINNVIQISPLSVTNTLSDPKRYPYFVTTQQSSHAKMYMLLAMLNKYNWNKFAVIAENTEPFSTEYANFLELLTRSNKTATLSLTYSREDAASISSTLQRIKSSGIYIIISINYRHVMLRMICEAYRAGLTGDRYVWINDYAGAQYSNFWDAPAVSGSDCTAKEWVKGLENQFVAVKDVKVDQTQTTVLHKSIENIKREISNTYGEQEANSIFQQLSGPLGSLYEKIADAVLTCAMALNASQEKIHPQKLENISYESGRRLLDTLYQSSTHLQFQGLSGDVSFTETGDRHAVFKMYKINNGSVGEAILKYTEAMDKMEYLESDEKIWSGKPRRDEDIEVITVVSIPEPLFQTYIVISAVVGALSLFLVAAHCLCRKRSVLKYSWPFLNDVIAVGCLAICAVVILKGFDVNRVTRETFLTICKASNWLLALGFTLTIGAMLAKMWAIYSFFYNQVPKDKKTVNEGGSIAFVLVMLLVDAGIMVAWMVVDPFKMEEEMIKESIDSSTQTVYKDFIVSCTSDNATYWIIAFFCYKGIVMILAGFLTWPAWVISSRHNISDSHYIGIALYGCIVSCVIAVPVSFLVQQDPSLQYGITGGFMLASMLLTLCLLLIPKLVALRHETDERIAKINSPIGALFGFMSVLSDSGALPGAGKEQAKDMFAVNLALATAEPERGDVNGAGNEEIN